MVGRCSVAVLNDFSQLGEYADLRVLSTMIFYLSRPCRVLVGLAHSCKGCKLLNCAVPIVGYVIISLQPALVLDWYYSMGFCRIWLLSVRGDSVDGFVGLIRSGSDIGLTLTLINEFSSPARRALSHATQ
jgi:hypothetical protein